MAVVMVVMVMVVAPDRGRLVEYQLERGGLVS
jgi:hypothetical protein